MKELKILVPAAEAAAMLSIGKSTLWREVKANRLPAPVKFGGVTRWRVSDLQNFIDSLGQPNAATGENDTVG
ncbi:MAG: helix-turn-helix domain-containing protein [Polaromonas sp.]|nr:helix-turn-helix domain-containing protein [Polaromonas sp.]